MTMFSFADIYNLDPETDGIVGWCFSDDLRKFFPEAESNHDISEILKSCGVFETSDQCYVDTEHSCFYIYFNSREGILEFLERLNAVPQIQNFVDSDIYGEVAMSQADWEKLRDFLRNTLTAEQYKSLQELGIEISHT